MSTIKEQIERLKSLAEIDTLGLDAPCAMITWLSEDIRYRAEDLEINIDDEQIAIILDDIESNHDAEYGISWTDVDIYLEATTRGE